MLCACRRIDDIASASADSLGHKAACFSFLLLLSTWERNMGLLGLIPKFWHAKILATF